MVWKMKQEARRAWGGWEKGSLSLRRAGGVRSGEAGSEE